MEGHCRPSGSGQSRGPTRSWQCGPSQISSLGKGWRKRMEHVEFLPVTDRCPWRLLSSGISSCMEERLQSPWRDARPHYEVKTKARGKLACGWRRHVEVCLWGPWRGESPAWQASRPHSCQARKPRHPSLRLGLSSSSKGVFSSWPASFGFT